MPRYPFTWRTNVVVPGAIYLLAYVVLTFPAIAHFSSDFFSDAGDGFQNVWNLWWVARAVKAGTNPWFTYLLHFPRGTSLVAHTLNPFNGFAAVLIGTVLTPVQTYNTLVIFSFVVGGLTAFWLSWELTREYFGSLLCGYLFTFSAYHLAHAEGHLQLIALEWLPLFLLEWWKLLSRPSIPRGVGTAASLFLVILCDYYYFFFSVLAGGIILIWHLIVHRHEGPWRRRPLLVSVGVFVLTSTVLCGPLLVALLRLVALDPLMGAHDANEFSMDLLAPLIPGGQWRFAQWTRWYWERLPGNINESSVSWGLSTIALMVVGYRSRSAATTWFGLWSTLLAFFGLMALGPKPRLLGRPLGHLAGPFALLEMVFPPLRLGGAPVRMSVIISLCVGLIAGFGFAVLWRRSARARWLAIVLVGGAVFESLPKPIPLTPSTVPSFVSAMQSLPKDAAMFDVDNAIGASRALYYQTLHEIPMVHGYISRVPKSVSDSDEEIDTLAALDQWKPLCEQYGIRYFIFASEHTPGGPLVKARIFEGLDGTLRFYDAGLLWACAPKPRETNPYPDLPALWEPGAPNSQTETPGGSCFIDSINARDPRLGGRSTLLKRSERIQIRGWAILPESRSSPEPVHLRLVRSDGTTYEVAATRLVRADVAMAFREPGYLKAGIHFAGSVGSVPPGSYRLMVVQGDAAEQKLCDSGLGVVLQ